MRKRIFEIIEVAKDGDRASDLYDSIMLVLIIISIVPLAFKSQPHIFVITDFVTTTAFIIDYILRWLTADYRQNKHTMISFVKYPFTLWAIIDLVSILPSFQFLASGFKLLRIFRMIRMFRIFRVAKAMRYSKSMSIIADVIKNSKSALMAVASLATGYILVAALVIFSVEPESFNTFFDAVYWATISLTTVGYGDVYAVSTVGKIVTMISSILGIAVVALPAGVITAGYMKALEEDNDADNRNEENEQS